jgi:hypothetical protein
MTAVVNLNINGYNDQVAAIRTLQAYLSQPVSTAIDNQGLQAEVIKLQTFLSTQVAGGQPSGFKFDPAKVRKSITDHGISGAIIELQKSADLT